MKIDRAKMRIRISLPKKEAKQAHEKIKQLMGEIEAEDWDEGALEMVCDRHLQQD
jgi:ribosome maturation protein SDO1